MGGSDPLPQEIWWIVAGELDEQRDFHGLYTMSCVSKGLASLALPYLYGIHDLSPICAGETLFSLPKWICLWRSIINSSMEQTLFPYCLWVKSLRLGNLLNLLEDLAKETEAPVNVPKLRDVFFSPPLDTFHVIDETKNLTRSKARKSKVMNLDAIAAKVGDTVTQFVKAAADMQDRTVVLSSLEGLYLPTANLTTWITRMANLTSLTIRDGSVLNSSVGMAIQQNCPSFKELSCYFCSGADLDQELAGFFLALPPNTLETFKCYSVNDIGAQSLAGLNTHAKTLKNLQLYVQQDALLALDALQDCIAMTHVSLETPGPLMNLNWETTYPGVYEAVVGWLKKCTAMVSLDINRLPNAPSLLANVLKAPEIKLLALTVIMSHRTNDFADGLACQKLLQTLAVATFEESVDADEPGHVHLMNAVANCSQLRRLWFKSEVLSTKDVHSLTKTAPFLEEFRFNGDMLGDDNLTALAGFRYLKDVNILGTSFFTLLALQFFIDDLASHPNASVAHAGMSLLITQLGEGKFSKAEEMELERAMWEKFRGRIDIGYVADPDEEHESDFSD